MGRTYAAQRLKLPLLIGILGVLGIGLKKGVLLLASVEKYTLYIDPCLAPAVHPQLRDFLTRLHLTTKQITIHNACTALRAAFPFIKTAEGHLYAPHTAHYQIIAKKPFMKINNNQVLTYDNTLLSTAFFDVCSLDSLGIIATARHLDATEQAPESLVILAHALAPAIVHTHTVTWHHNFLTTLQNRYHENKIIICIADLPPNESIIAQCAQIFSTLESTSKKKGQLVADVRFANQIVIRAEQGGSAHG